VARGKGVLSELLLGKREGSGVGTLVQHFFVP